MKHRLIIILLTSILFSCEKFEYSNYQVSLDEEYHNINQINIAQLLNTTTDTVRIAIIGDSQRYYDATSKIMSLKFPVSRALNWEVRCCQNLGMFYSYYGWLL